MCEIDNGVRHGRVLVEEDPIGASPFSTANRHRRMAPDDRESSLSDRELIGAIFTFLQVSTARISRLMVFARGGG